ENPTFVHFSEVRSITDEIKLQSACNLVLHLNKSDLRFAAATSTDYQEWYRVFSEAIKMSSTTIAKGDVGRQQSVTASLQSGKARSANHLSQAAQPHQGQRSGKSQILNSVFDWEKTDRQDTPVPTVSEHHPPVRRSSHQHSEVETMDYESEYADETTDVS